MIIVVYGSRLVPNYSTITSSRWKCKNKSKNCIAYHHQQLVLAAICRSSINNDGRTSSNTTSSNSLLWHKPLSASRIKIGSVITTTLTIAVAVTATIVMVSGMSPNSDAGAFEMPIASSFKQHQQSQLMEFDETLSDIPQTLSSQDGTYCSSTSTKEDNCKKRPRIQRPKSKKAESCTINCVTTCIRGGGGSPGQGPLNIRGPIVVFKQGFHSRQYCLIECSDICNLIGDGDSGP